MLMIAFYVCVCVCAHLSSFFFFSPLSLEVVVWLHVSWASFFFLQLQYLRVLSNPAEEKEKKKKKKRKKNNCWFYGVQCCPLSRETWMSKKKKKEKERKVAV